jgi:hypothetical protein
MLRDMGYITWSRVNQSLLSHSLMLRDLGYITWSRVNQSFLSHSLMLRFCSCPESKLYILRVLRSPERCLDVPLHVPPMIKYDEPRLFHLTVTIMFAKLWIGLYLFYHRWNNLGSSYLIMGGTCSGTSKHTDYTSMARVAQKWLQLKKILILSISILLHTIANKISIVSILPQVKQPGFIILDHGRYMQRYV